MTRARGREWNGRRGHLVGAAALALALGGVSCGELPSDEVELTESAILDGTKVNPADYPAVGMVWAATGTPGQYDTGTGTLFGSRYVVTAAHVVEKQWGVYPPNIFVEFDKGGGKVRYTADTVFIHPSYLQSITDPVLKKLWDGYRKDGVFDVALLILSQAPVGITPVPLSTAVPTPSTAVSFLGYGRIATGGATPVPNTDKSLYRGTNTIRSFDETYARIEYTQGTSGTWSGDSGGPVLIGNSIAAVITSGTWYTYGSIDTFTRLATIQPWIYGILPGGTGPFAADAYESTEQTRPAFRLNTLGHYSEPRSLTGSADLDTISFQLDSSSHVRISVPHHFTWTTTQPSVTVTKDGATVPLAFPNTALYEADLGPGTYVATVKNNSPRGLSYTLGISADGWFVQADPFEPDGPTRAWLVPLGVVTAHNILPMHDEDYVSFTIGQTSNVRIETLPLSGNPDNDRTSDTVITLMTADGVELDYNDDKPNSNSYCSLIERRLDPGTYRIKIGGYMGNLVGYYGIRTSTY